MAVKKESRREHNPVKSSKRRAKEQAAQLAPLEERTGRGGKTHQAKGDGPLAVDTGKLKLPEGFMSDSEASARNGLPLEPVVIFILVCALAYIAVIIYLISIQPSQ